MQINYLHTDSLLALKNDIEKNIDYYQGSESPWLENYFSESEIKTPFYPIGIEVPDVQFTQYSPDSDFDNAVKLYEALKDKISRNHASDNRLWGYMTHETFWNYMRRRWGGSKKGTIQGRYFWSKSLFRNGIARLYWGPALTYCQDYKDPYELTRVLFETQDIFNQMSYSFLRNPAILRPFLKVLKAHGRISEEQARAYFMEVKLSGEVAILDALSEPQAIELFDEILKKVLNKRYTRSGDTITLQYSNSPDKQKYQLRGGKLFREKKLIKTTPQNVTGFTLGKEIEIIHTKKSKTQAVIVEIE